MQHTSRNSKRILCWNPRQFHQMHYNEWKKAPRDSLVTNLVCVHGLARNGRDFDYLANKFIDDAELPYDTILSPDVAGRGESDWLINKEDYNYAQYQSDISTLIAAYANEKKIDYIGTSMGGLLGMILASIPNNPIRKLVINDVGPFVPREALIRIGGYVGKNPVFENFDQVVEYHKRIYKPFGLTDEQYRLISTTSFRKDSQNPEQYRLHYDPNIGHAFEKDDIQDLVLWPIWENITCPVLIVRGKESDLLKKEIVDEMKLRCKTKCEVVEFDNVGHAPCFMTDEQLEPIKRFLLS